MKICFEKFKQIMLYDVIKNNTCIEIEFSVDKNDVYTSCYLGKKIEEKHSTVAYWFGLTPDGLNAYDFSSIEQFMEAKVFDGNSIEEIWDSISLYSIDGCDIEERLPFYFCLENFPKRR